MSTSFHKLCSGMHLKTHVLKDRSRKQNTTSLPISHCIKESSTRFLLIFSIYYRIDNCSESATLNHSCHSHCSSTGKYLEIHSWSIVDHKRLSGWKTVTAKVTGQTHTHTHEREAKRRRAGEAWGQLLGVLGAARLGTGVPRLQQPPHTSAGWPTLGAPCFPFLWNW